MSFGKITNLTAAAESEVKQEAPPTKSEIKTKLQNLQIHRMEMEAEIAKYHQAVAEIQTELAMIELEKQKLVFCYERSPV